MRWTAPSIRAAWVQATPSGTVTPGATYTLLGAVPYGQTVTVYLHATVVSNAVTVLGLSATTDTISVTDFSGTAATLDLTPVTGSVLSKTLTLAPQTVTRTTVSTSQPSVVYGTPVTVTATVSAQAGSTAPTAGSVDFVDTTTSTDLGLGTFGSSNGLASTWILVTGVKSFNVTTADTITATYTLGMGFADSFGTTTQAVTARPMTITAAASTKMYDGTTSAAATPTVVGLVGSDTLTGLSESYDTRNAGTGKTLTVAGYVVNDGNGGNNYAVTAATAVAGVIDQAPLTITAAANVKIYDGTTSAAATPTVVGLLGSDTVTGLSETYDTKNAGIFKTLTPAGSVNDGNSGHNYAVTFATTTVNAVYPRAITVTAVANTKIYDGTTSAAAIPTINSGGLASGDTPAFSETYDTPHAARARRSRRPARSTMATAAVTTR